MIIRKTPDDELVLVPQTEHSKLVGQLAALWGNETFAKPEPVASMVRAATYHDFGWLGYEADPAFNGTTGETPHYLDVPNARSQLDAYQYASDWMGGIDPYAGMLISMHRTGLWQRRYDVIDHPKAYLQPAGRLPVVPNDDVKTFITRNEAAQALVRTNLDEAQVWTNYRLLQVWDLLGLYFSCHDPDDLYITPVPTTYSGGKSDGVRLTLKPVESNTVAFDPFPFRTRGATIVLPIKRLSHRSFANADAFRDAYFTAKSDAIVFTLV